IYPSALTERGLAAAVQAFATRAPLNVHLRELPRRRYSQLTEATAYFIVTAALAGASDEAVVVMADAPEGVMVEITGAGSAGGIAERVAAIGGRLEIDGSTLRAELPA